MNAGVGSREPQLARCALRRAGPPDRACPSAGTARIRGSAPGRRPRRLTDDLAWLRVALEDPEPHGLQPLGNGHAVAAWAPDATASNACAASATAPSSTQRASCSSRTSPTQLDRGGRLDSRGQAGVAQLVEHLICNQAAGVRVPLRLLELGLYTFAELNPDPATVVPTPGGGCARWSRRSSSPIRSGSTSSVSEASPAGLRGLVARGRARGRSGPDTADPALERGDRAELGRPVRVVQDFAKLGGLLDGRARSVPGRGSYIESFPLFGFDLDDSDKLFAEERGLFARHCPGTDRSMRGVGEAPGGIRRKLRLYPRPIRTGCRCGSGGRHPAVDRAAAGSACRSRSRSSAATPERFCGSSNLRRRARAASIPRPAHSDSTRGLRRRVLPAAPGACFATAHVIPPDPSSSPSSSPRSARERRSAAPTVTVTGDDGNPVPLNAVAPVGIRKMDVTVDAVRPRRPTRAIYTSQVFDAAGTPASSLSTCRATRSSDGEELRRLPRQRDLHRGPALLHHRGRLRLQRRRDASGASATRSTPAPR